MANSNISRTKTLSIVGCLIVQLCVGIIYLWSIFKTPVAEAFGCGTGPISMVSSYMLMAFVIGCFLGGILNDRKGARLTCLVGVIVFSVGIGASALLTAQTIALINVTYAIVGGFGSGLAYSACVSCVQKWMPERRGVATGLAVSAFGLSTVIFSPVSRVLMSAFTSASTGLVNFRAVFTVLAFVFLVLGLGATLMIRNPEIKAAKQTNGSKVEVDVPFSKAVRTPQFWYIFFTVFFINGTWNLTVPVLYDLGIERGLSAAAATLAVSCTGIPNSAGRLLMASLSDKIGRRSCICLLSVATAAAAWAMIFAHGWAYIVVVCVIAFAYGGPSSVNAAMTTDYFGSRSSGTNYGVIMLALGLSSLFFNLLSSTVLGGNITLSFIVAAVSAVIPLVLMAVIGPAPAEEGKKHKKDRKTHMHAYSHGA